MRCYTLPTLFLVLSTIAGGCAFGPPETEQGGRNLVALEPEELPSDLEACADLYGATEEWPEADGIYRVAGHPGIRVLSVNAQLDCRATDAELAERSDFAEPGQFRPLTGDSPDVPTGDKDSASAGERGDSNPLPAGPIPTESADDSNPLPARGGLLPSSVATPADDSNPLPARNPSGHHKDLN